MLVSVSVLDSGRDHNPKRRKEMKKVRFNYWKLTAVVAILAITLIGLSGLLSMTTIAQEKRTLPTREIDLRAKLKDKTFADGRRVVIETLASGEKIVAEIKGGNFVNWFLVAPDGTEVQGVAKKKHSTTTTTITCTETMTTTTTVTIDGKAVTTTRGSVFQIPCPAGTPPTSNP